MSRQTAQTVFRSTSRLTQKLSSRDANKLLASENFSSAIRSKQAETTAASSNLKVSMAPS